MRMNWIAIALLSMGLSFQRRKNESSQAKKSNAGFGCAKYGVPILYHPSKVLL
jgi:hypothetical protein